MPSNFRLHPPPPLSPPSLTSEKRKHGDGKGAKGILGARDSIERDNGSKEAT